MDFKKYFMKKEVQILAASAGAYLGLKYLLQGVFELDTTLLYLLVSVILGNLITFKNMKAKHYAIIGLLMPTLYNLLFSLLGLFSFTFIILAVLFIGAQQAIITFIIAKIAGVK